MPREIGEIKQHFCSRHVRGPVGRQVGLEVGFELQKNKSRDLGLKHVVFGLSVSLEIFVMAL